MDVRASVDVTEKSARPIHTRVLVVVMSSHVEEGERGRWDSIDLAQNALLVGVHFAASRTAQ